MDLTYWPLADAHSPLLWTIMPHGGDAVVPFHHVYGHHFSYSRIEIFGTHSFVAMDEQQMRARNPGVSKKLLPRAWPNRYVGVDLKSSAYLVLDIDKNQVRSVRLPSFIRKYTEFGQAISQPDGELLEQAITQGAITPLIDSGKIVPVDSVPDGEFATNTSFVLTMPWKPRDDGPPVQVRKCRMAVDGSWHYGFDQCEVTCPVADLPTFRFLFILSVIFAFWDVLAYHYDVNQAFMHAPLEVPIHIRFPFGYKYLHRYGYAKLLYALYGLRTAGASWQTMTNKFMLSFTYKGRHFTESTYDPCFYFIVTTCPPPLWRCMWMTLVYVDADHARDKVNDCLSYSGGGDLRIGYATSLDMRARQANADMSSTGSEYVAASVVGQRAMSTIHMVMEIFGHVTIARQIPSACVAITKPPTTDAT
ncbi:hypothetical protein CYMTET_26299, partial [Cymbomonas tetramitiformis]